MTYSSTSIFENRTEKNTWKNTCESAILFGTELHHDRTTNAREETVRLGQLQNAYPGPKNIAEEINRRRLALPISAVKLTVKGKGNNVVVDEKEKLTAAEKEGAPFVRVQGENIRSM
jgi:hypothetical protein